MDVQRGVVDRFADDAEYLPRLGKAISAARAAGVPVIYVVVGFRPGYPEVSERNAAFSRIAASGAFAGPDPAAEVHPAIAPAPGEATVTKRRVSAFAGSDLDMLLRARDIDSLVLAGVATSGVVLSTVRLAADLDYRLTVLSDGCLDSDPGVHRVLTEKVFPRQARVATIDEWTSGLAS
jgi:nicotinamidase-related amidase